jgi:hypothetical protein
MRTRPSCTQNQAPPHKITAATTSMPAAVELTVMGKSATDSEEEAEALVLEPSPQFLRDRRRLSQTPSFSRALVFLLAAVALVGAAVLRNERLGDTPEAFQPPEEPMTSSTNFGSPTTTYQRVLRIQIASDLHIEFYGTLDNVPSDIIIPRAPVLALLGDVGLAFTPLL